MPACYRHPGRETNVSCSNCGRPICPDCMTSTPVGMRCPECARQRTRVHRAPAGIGSGSAPVTFTLIAVNVVAYLVEMVGGGSSALNGGGSTIVDFGLNGPAVEGGDWYRIVTAGFLHAGLLHLGFNMFALYFLGGLLEPAIGPWRFAGVYFVSLLGGSFGALLLDPNELTVGASGAVFGLMAAAFIVARNRGLDDLASQIGLFVVLNLVITFGVSNISVGGHLGGLVAGGLAALAIAAGERRGRDGRVMEWAALVGLGAAAVVGCVIAAADSVPSGLG
jgi:membrane associated rhomboid family serine protease